MKFKVEGHSNWISDSITRKQFISLVLDSIHQYLICY